jgi:K+ transporter
LEDALGVAYLPAVMMVMVMVVVTVVVTAAKSAAVTAAKSAAVSTAKSAAVTTAVTAVSKAQRGKKYGIGVGCCCQGGQKDLKKEINNLKQMSQ